VDDPRHDAAQTIEGSCVVVIPMYGKRCPGGEANVTLRSPHERLRDGEARQEGEHSALQTKKTSAIR
jgi:hypothetical protein